MVVSGGPRVVGRWAVDAGQASRLWGWVLARQGLHPDRRLGSVAEVARAGLGIHAARLASPVAIVAARTGAADTALDVAADTAADTALGVGLGTVGWLPGRGLTTIRCMRRTLHLLPVDLARVAHYATAGYRERDALRLAARSGATPAVVDRVGDQVMAVLGGGPMEPRGIEAALAGEGVAVPVARAAVKVAWERGLLTCLNLSGAWNRQRRVFAVTEATVPGLLAGVDPRRARRDLVAGYFDRYGPATLADVVWWSALSRRDVLTAMDDATADLGVGWVEVAIPWSASPAYLPARRHEQFLTEEPLTAGTVALLAHEDVALKAYHETRVRYLGDLAAGRVFNRIGEVLPTVVLDGRVIGRWEWDPRRLRVSTSLLVRGVPPEARADVTRVARTLTATLRAGWAPPPGHTGHTGRGTGPPPAPGQLSLPVVPGEAIAPDEAVVPGGATVPASTLVGSGP